MLNLYINAYKLNINMLFCSGILANVIYMATIKQISFPKRVVCWYTVEIRRLPSTLQNSLLHSIWSRHTRMNFWVTFISNTEKTGVWMYRNKSRWEAVTALHLLTGHDCLAMLLNRIGILAEAACLLCEEKVQTTPVFLRNLSWW